MALTENNIKIKIISRKAFKSVNLIISIISCVSLFLFCLLFWTLNMWQATTVNKTNRVDWIAVILVIIRSNYSSGFTIFLSFWHFFIFSFFSFCGRTVRISFLLFKWGVLWELEMSNFNIVNANDDFSIRKMSLRHFDVLSLWRIFIGNLCDWILRNGSWGFLEKNH